jgi:hypothetical protein
MADLDPPDTGTHPLANALDLIDKLLRPSYDGYQFGGQPRFQDFRRSDDVEDRRRQSYYQSVKSNPTPEEHPEYEFTGREQGTNFDYDYLSYVVRAGLLTSTGPNPLSLAAGINDIPYEDIR